MIDQIDSSIQAPVAQKSVIEKSTNNPCKSLPDVAGQAVIRPSQAEFVDQKSPSKCTETNSSTSTLGGQQNNGNGVGCTAIGLTGSPTGLTASLRVSQKKIKAKVGQTQEIRDWCLENC